MNGGVTDESSLSEGVLRSGGDGQRDAGGGAAADLAASGVGAGEAAGSGTQPRALAAVGARRAADGGGRDGGRLRAQDVRAGAAVGGASRRARGRGGGTD